jgi:hypothetical protein
MFRKAQHKEQGNIAQSAIWRERKYAQSAILRAKLSKIFNIHKKYGII